MKKIEKKIVVSGRELTISTGELAGQADCAVLATYGETVLLATVVASPMKEDIGYFPLKVEYQERLYAGGKIKGSRWVKREGRPTDDEILTARVIDRTIRPLFPKNYVADVQVIVTVLSVDGENDPKVLAPVAVSAALTASSVPWEGPVGLVAVGLVDGQLKTNPLKTDEVDLEVVVASTKKAIVMIEAEASEVPEDVVLDAIAMAQKEGAKLIKLIDDFAAAVNNKKDEVATPPKNVELTNIVEKIVRKDIKKIVEASANKNWDYVNAIKNQVKEAAGEGNEGEAMDIFDYAVKNEIRAMILSGNRPDGRKLDDIRKLSSVVGLLPRTHGSAVFNRGTTQVLNAVTLGPASAGQTVESAEDEIEKHYIHHYSMPPYSVGETGRVGGASRREIGHGALAEKALMPVIPSQEDFPYTIRLVSEAISSNGSTSMASTCASTLALMDAGVPISTPVSGIAMGLVIESDDKYSVLTDIAGIEDFNGDMDFKVTGTAKGVTALQLDVKTLNLTHKILVDAMAKAKKGRAVILESMLKTIPEPRKELSERAPRVESFSIDPEKIGEVIGPGGKIIKSIIADTGADVNIEDSGVVTITGVDRAGVTKAIEMVKSIVKVPEAGEIFEGTVKRIQSFGAFVEILPGKDGMVHVSDMSEGFVSNPEEIVKIGDKVQVRVKEVDRMGRINLSMLMDPSKDKKKEDRPRGPRRDDRGGGRRGGAGSYSRGPRHDDRRGPRRDTRGSGPRGPRRDGGRSDRPSGGPHFPTSRLVGNNENKNRFKR